MCSRKAISTFHSLSDLYRLKTYRLGTLGVLCWYKLWCVKGSLENIKYVLGYLLCDAIQFRGQGCMTLCRRQSERMNGQKSLQGNFNAKPSNVWRVCQVLFYSIFFYFALYWHCMQPAQCKWSHKHVACLFNTMLFCHLGDLSISFTLAERRHLSPNLLMLKVLRSGYFACTWSLLFVVSLFSVTAATWCEQSKLFCCF